MVSVGGKERHPLDLGPVMRTKDVADLAALCRGPTGGVGACLMQVAVVRLRAVLVCDVSDADHEACPGGGNASLDGLLAGVRGGWTGRSTGAVGVVAEVTNDGEGDRREAGRGRRRKGCERGRGIGAKQVRPVGGVHAITVARAR